MVEIFDGLKATSQNHWPSLRHDVGAVNDALYMLLSAGFYYKTFMWPRSFWNTVYEPFTPRPAVLGKAPSASHPDPYASPHAPCDGPVVRAGPAGPDAAPGGAEDARGGERGLRSVESEVG